MCYLLHELAKEGYSGAIVYMPEFVEELKSMLQDSDKLRETVEMMKQVDLLIFDDIGAENLNPWVRDHVLGSILNYRIQILCFKHTFKMSPKKYRVEQMRIDHTIHRIGHCCQCVAV